MEGYGNYQPGSASMIIYNCMFTGKEVFSDAFPHKLENDITWTVDGMYYKEESDQKVVNNLVKSFRLEEPVAIKSAEEFKKVLKKYLVDLVDKIKPERRDALKSKLPTFSKSLIENFNSIRVYVTEGDGHEVRGTIIIMTQNAPFGKEKPNDTCTMTVLTDSLVKEEF